MTTKTTHISLPPPRAIALLFRVLCGRWTAALERSGRAEQERDGFPPAANLKGPVDQPRSKKGGKSARRLNWPLLQCHLPKVVCQCREFDATPFFKPPYLPSPGNYGTESTGVLIEALTYSTLRRQIRRNLDCERGRPCSGCLILLSRVLRELMDALRVALT